VEEALPYFRYFGIDVAIQVLSAHRTPEAVRTFAQNARAQGFSIIVACAGLAAHLPGVLAAYTDLPVIGVPLASGPLNGQDALLSMVQMPSGIPVATMAIGKAGVRNAAIFCAQILALQDEHIQSRLSTFKQNQCRIPE